MKKHKFAFPCKNIWMLKKCSRYLDKMYGRFLNPDYNPSKNPESED